jgi:hypothetical protein
MSQQGRNSRDLENRRAAVRIPAGSLLYERIVPLLLVVMALVMLIIVLIAAGILLGIVPYQ